MDGPRDYHIKLFRGRQISYDITYIWNLKKWTEIDSQTENKLTATKGG